MKSPEPARPKKPKSRSPLPKTRSKPRESKVSKPKPETSREKLRPAPQKQTKKTQLSSPDSIIIEMNAQARQEVPKKQCSAADKSEKPFRFLTDIEVAPVLEKVFEWEFPANSKTFLISSVQTFFVLCSSVLSLVLRLVLRLRFEQLTAFYVLGVVAVVLLHVPLFFSSPEKVKFNVGMLCVLTLLLGGLSSSVYVECAPYLLLFWGSNLVCNVISFFYFKQKRPKIETFRLFLFQLLAVSMILIFFLMFPAKEILSFVLVGLGSLLFSFFQSVDANYILRDPRFLEEKCAYYVVLLLMVDSLYVAFIRVIIYLFF